MPRLKQIGLVGPIPSAVRCNRLIGRLNDGTECGLRPAEQGGRRALSGPNRVGRLARPRLKRGLSDIIAEARAVPAGRFGLARRCGMTLAVHMALFDS